MSTGLENRENPETECGQGKFEESCVEPEFRDSEEADGEVEEGEEVEDGVNGEDEEAEEEEGSGEDEEDGQGENSDDSDDNFQTFEG